MKLCVLGSGSRGNAIFVSTGATRVLVDAGLSTLALKQRLESIGEDLDRLSGVVISHEHADHVRALPVFTRKVKVPVFMTPTCAARLRVREEINGVEYFDAGDEWKIGDLTFRSFSVPHDAGDPVGFVVTNGERAVGIATDLGTVTSLVRERLKNMSALVIESNHDPDMLIDGPYPWELKQRIQSRVGHLANSDSAGLVADMYHKGLSHIFLAHLSATNNTPKLALDALEQRLAPSAARVHVTAQGDPSECISL